MKTKFRRAGESIISVLALSAYAWIGAPALGQADDEPGSAGEETTVEEPRPITVSLDQLEEVIVMGRYRAAATDIVSERIESDTPLDILDAEMISRVGDSDVAAALRRVPGLTLVEDKFVYVRGLGERYSSAQLNGAYVPSPDLTRNVLPLDIFPADLIDSVAVHKGYAPELAAAFGGGSVDIRTKKVPEDRVFGVDFKTGLNTVSGNSLSYPGGSKDKWGVDDGTRALASEISSAIDNYRGSFSPLTILRTAVEGVEVGDIYQARAVNRQIGTFLNRDIDLQPQELREDVEADLMAGHRVYLSDEIDVGVLVLGSYSSDWRLKERFNRRFANPDTDFSFTERTVNEVDVTGSLNVGVRVSDDHEIGGMRLLLRNTEDEVSSSKTCSQGQFNDCFDASSPSQGRITSIRFEERELLLTQFDGTHLLGGATIDAIARDLPFFEWFARFEGAYVNWYYTDAMATTSIPNEVRVSGQETLTEPNGAVQQYRVRATGTAADYRFSELRDQVENFGFDFMVPFLIKGYDLELSGGYDYARKARNYKQTSLGLGSTSGRFGGISSDTPSVVFSDANLLNLDYLLTVLVGIGEFGSESYMAAQIIDAGYGKFDLQMPNDWRVSGGLRQEIFKQLSVPVDWLEYQGSRIGVNSEEDAQALADAILITDDWYPSLSVSRTRTMPFLWDADQFQLRAGVSRTVARPDIRETTESTYIDPITEARVRGNPHLEVSDLVSYDLRFEWYWDSGDSFSTSLFYKDIDKPIETVQGGATEDNIRFNFVNAESAQVYGIEVEWLKALGFLREHVADWMDAFYLSGNTTLSGSQIDIPPGSGVGNITNQTRRLTQQSNWVVNLQLGFDSFDGVHGATLVYNAFGERIFFAGIDGLPDGYEQPFHSLDVVYSWYPTDRMTVKARFKNLLGSQIEVKQGDVSIIEQNIGTTGSISLSWEL